MTQGLLVAQGKIHGLHRPLEDRQQAIGLVDQAAAGELQQVPDLQVEPAQGHGRPRVAEPLDERGRVHQIGKQHRPQQRRDRAVGPVIG